MLFLPTTRRKTPSGILISKIRLFRVLGYAGATITTVIVGASTYYTCIVLWRFCLAHPQVRDVSPCRPLSRFVFAGANSCSPFTCSQIADAAQILCGGRRIGWYIAYVSC